MRLVTRALALAGILALIAGAAWAAPAKSKKKGTAAKDTVLVWVGKEAITAATVQKRIDELPEQVRGNFTTPEGRQRLLERLVEERVWLASAEREGLSKRPDLVQQLDQQRRDLLIRTRVNEVMAANPAPSDSDAKVYYETHQAEFRVPATVSVSHIQVKAEADGKRVRQAALKKGADWKALVTKYSLDTLSRSAGGQLGTVAREGAFGSMGFQPALSESAFALPDGGIGGPIKSDRGWHVIKADNHRPESIRPYEQVRGSILRTVGGKRSQEYYQARLADERAALGVKPDSTAIRNFLTQKRSARDMFNDAQSAGPAEARIEGYRRLLAEYPESDVSPQAQFMIGFIQSEELKRYEDAEQSFRELLRRYPKSELVSSAQWMLEHMREEGAPAFMNLETESGQGSAGKP